MAFLRKNKMLILYACCLALLFLFLKLAEYRLLIVDHSFEIYVGTIALLFMLLGLWLSSKIFAPKKETHIIERQTIVEKEIFIAAPSAFILNTKALKETDISARELEVLQLVARGLSNQEIAAALFVSINTIKTHLTNLFFKLDVTRRTQAVQKAKQLSIIP